MLFLGSIFYGLIMEFTTGMLISRSYIQGEFTVMVETKQLLGYGTDMPLYVVVGFYPVIIFLGFKLIESFGIHSVLARAVSAGIFMLLIDAPYTVNGSMKNVNWWVWLDRQVGGRHIFQYWYTWPMADAMWELTWPSLLMWMVWHWERRRACNPAMIAAAKAAPWKTLLGTPVVLGILMNACGLLLGIPFDIVIGLGLPQYPSSSPSPWRVPRCSSTARRSRRRWIGWAGFCWESTSSATGSSPWPTSPCARCLVARSRSA